MLHTMSLFSIVCDALRDLVPFVQFKKREKHPWRSVNFKGETRICINLFNTKGTTEYLPSALRTY